MSGEIHNKASLDRHRGSQRRIGITGGIASGKSSIGAFLKEIKGLPVLDADVYANEALAPGETCTIAVLERYGNAVNNQIKNKLPTINRLALSKIIFNDPKERLWIEKLIHPVVQMRFQKELNALKSAPTVALIIPLLFEAKFTGLCTEIWVINCKISQQYKRLKKRDGLTDMEARNRIQAQWPLIEKLNLADIVIENSGEFKAWIKVVDKLC